MLSTVGEGVNLHTNIGVLLYRTRLSSTFSPFIRCSKDSYIQLPKGHKNDEKFSVIADGYK